MASFRIAAFAAVTLWLATPLLAETPLDIRTGLWEVKSERSSTGMLQMSKMPSLPPDVLAKLPPAQRAQIENAMRARKKASGSHVSKFCVTEKTLVKLPDFSMGDRQARCTRTKYSRTARGWQVQEVCHSGSGKQTMSIRYDVLNQETITGTVDVAMHDRGHDITMKHVMHGRWLGADCGDVKSVE